MLHLFFQGKLKSNFKHCIKPIREKLVTAVGRRRATPSVYILLNLLNSCLVMSSELGLLKHSKKKIIKEVCV